MRIGKEQSIVFQELFMHVQIKRIQKYNLPKFFYNWVTFSTFF